MNQSKSYQAMGWVRALLPIVAIVLGYGLFFSIPWNYGPPERGDAYWNDRY